MKIPSDTKLKIIIVVLVLQLVGFSVFLFFFNVHKFPDSIPSSDDLSLRNENYKEQLAFFNKYTRYIRDNHGGLIEAEEINKSISVSGQKGYSFIVFRHRFKYFDRSLLLRLTSNFALSENIGHKVYEVPGESKDVPIDKNIEVVFLRQNNPWISIKTEMAEEFINEVKQKIQYTEVTELSKPDQDKPAPDPHEMPRLVIVIDDLGNNMNVFNKLIQLDFNITYSILPLQRYSMETAEMVHEAGREVILHLPMQPKDWPQYNPGLGALLLEDSKETIYEKMETNLRTVPYAIGVNNHMGSSFTQYSSGLDVLMQILSDRNLFFLDSKTAPGDIAKQSAREANIQYLSRNIFLDNIQDDASIKKQLYMAARIAKKWGNAIAIGHPYLTTYDTLATHLPLLEKQGIAITRVSQLLPHKQ